MKTLSEKKGINRKQKLHEKCKALGLQIDDSMDKYSLLQFYSTLNLTAWANTDKAAALLVHVWYIAEIHLSQGSSHHKKFMEKQINTLLEGF